MKIGMASSGLGATRMREASGLAPSELRQIIACKALESVPRLLSFEDRTPLSRFEGCFDREYWHAHSTDFPNGLRQHTVHPLALAWLLEDEHNPFHQSERLLCWISSGLDFTTRIQGPEGAWDEFYPNEKGFGATALVVYGCLSTVRILGDQLPRALVTRVLESMALGARFVGRHEKRVGFLANHYAFSLAALHRACQLIDEREFRPMYDEKMAVLDGLYHGEGWHTEYDGLDPGYQTATVGFLGRIYRDTRDPALLERVRKAFPLLSYFAYPDGHFAGSMGSRQTVHAYMHGFEVFSGEDGVAAALADRLARSVAAGILLQPQVQADRYVHYRVEDFLLTALDFNEDKKTTLPLPFEREDDFDADLPEAGIHVRKRSSYYFVTNLARGGVTKIFELPSGRRLYEDSGVLMETTDGSLFTSQWICDSNPSTASHRIGSEHPLFKVHERVFRPASFALFRAFSTTAARNPAISNGLKGAVRKIQMLDAARSAAAQVREIRFDRDVISLRLTLGLPPDDLQPTRVVMGGEWHIRYVPQSRFFQIGELETAEIHLSEAEVALLGDRRQVTLEVEVKPGAAEPVSVELTFGSVGTGGEYKDEIVDQFSRWQGGKVRYLWQRRVETLLPRLPEQGRVLDAGCGDLEAIGYMKRHRPSLDFFACDLSALCGESFVRADVRRLPFGSGTFRVVMMMAVIEHIPDHVQALREAFRVLEPGGALLLTTPNPLYGLPMAIAGRIGLKYREGYDNSISLGELIDLATTIGFEVRSARGFLALPVRTPIERIEEIFGAGVLGRRLLMNQFLEVSKPVEEVPRATGGELREHR